MQRFVPLLWWLLWTLLSRDHCSNGRCGHPSYWLVITPVSELYSKQLYVYSIALTCPIGRTYQPEVLSLLYYCLCCNVIILLTIKFVKKTTTTTTIIVPHHNVCPTMWTPNNSCLSNSWTNKEAGNTSKKTLEIKCSLYLYFYNTNLPIIWTKYVQVILSLLKNGQNANPNLENRIANRIHPWSQQALI